MKWQRQESTKKWQYSQKLILIAVEEAADIEDDANCDWPTSFLFLSLFTFTSKPEPELLLLLQLLFIPNAAGAGTRVFWRLHCQIEAPKILSHTFYVQLLIDDWLEGRLKVKKWRGLYLCHLYLRCHERSSLTSYQLVRGGSTRA